MRQALALIICIILALVATFAIRQHIVNNKEFTVLETQQEPYVHEFKHKGHEYLQFQINILHNPDCIKCLNE